jgi:hypothetical protein
MSGPGAPEGSIGPVVAEATSAVPDLGAASAAIGSVDAKIDALTPTMPHAAVADVAGGDLSAVMPSPIPDELKPTPLTDAEKVNLADERDALDINSPDRPVEATDAERAQLQAEKQGLGLPNTTPEDKPPAAPVPPATQEAVRDFNASQYTDTELLARGDINKEEFDTRQKNKILDADVRSGFHEKTNEQIQADALAQFPADVFFQDDQGNRRDEKQADRDKYIADMTARRDAAKGRAETIRNEAAEKAMKNFREGRGKDYVDPGDPQGEAQQRSAQEAQQTAKATEAATAADQTTEEKKAVAAAEEIIKNHQRLTELQGKFDTDPKSLSGDEYAEMQRLMIQPSERKDELKEKVDAKTATKEEFEEWKRLENGEPAVDPEKELEELDSAWRTTAESGKDPAEAMIAYYNKLAEQDGGQPLSDNEQAEFKKYMKEIYQDGVLPTPEGKNSAAIREKFVELGKIEAQLVALKAMIEKMKKDEKKMKSEVDNAEGSYLAEQNPQEKMRKLNDFRTKALRLEGYQIAINGQASEGRKQNIKRRQAVGFIHRNLGSKGLKGNMIFGMVTLAHETVDAFADVTVDQVRDRFA